MHRLHQARKIIATLLLTGVLALLIYAWAHIASRDWGFRLVVGGAAIGAALVQTVVDPQMCGIAGFGCCHIRLADGTHTPIDFHGRAPLATKPAPWNP